MELNEIVWMDIKKYIPECELQLIVSTPLGIRKCKRMSFYVFYMLTDCTHPMQNCHLSEYDILGWYYEDEQNMIDLRFTVNHYQHQKNGDEILKSIPKRKNIFQRLIRWIVIPETK